ncbi:MAG TPA: hypothetical protein VJA23_06195 [Candidatus Nanoarchaeia archaeon]|nr:hypothetical protein [Candidatus Nanoarchaeia archaeon]
MKIKPLFFFFVFILVFSLLIISTGCNETSTGQASFSFTPACYDTDGGIKLEERGAVKLSAEKDNYYQDTCIDSSTLVEYYCNKGDLNVSFKKCSEGTVCNQDACINPKNTFICGDGICQGQREINSGCAYDCGWPCVGKYCNQEINVYCACQESSFALLKEITPCKAKVTCNNCSQQEPLLDDFYDLQTQIYECLADYFQFQPLRIPYLIVYNPAEEKCTDPSGCSGYATGHSDPIGLSFIPLPGNRSYDQNQPTLPSQLVPEKHETTHYFLNHMLHSVPDWFKEAISIQTEERIKCHPQENPKGDAYLLETEVDLLHPELGINLANGMTLNEEFYQKWKNGGADLPETDKNNYYIQATLWLIGLKLDYSCTEDCIQKILQELRQQVVEECKISQEKCGLASWFVFENKDKFCSLDNPPRTGPTGAINFDPNPKSSSSSSKQTIVSKLNLKNNFKKKSGQVVATEAPKYWTYWANDQTIIDNSKIKSATDKIVGKDTQELFDKVGLK